MEQVIPGARDSNNTGATNYFSVVGSNGVSNTTENLVETIVATGGTISKLRINLTAAPSTGKSFVYTLRVNGVDSALTCTVADAATTASDTTHSVSVAAGDRVSIKAVPSGTPTASTVRLCVSFTGTTANESLILGSTRNTQLSTGSTEYLYISGENSPQSTESTTRMVVPTGGNVKNLYIDLITATGVGKTRTFTLLKNGVATSLVVAITNGSTGNDTTHSVSVVAGDELSIQSDVTTVPAASGVRYGMKFVATTDGESLIFGNNNASNPGAVQTRYFNLPDPGSIGSTTETNVGYLANATTLKKLYVVNNVAPGSGNTETRDLRVNQASPANDLSVAITGTATTGNDTTHTVTVADGDIIDMRMVMAVETDFKQARWGLVGFISSIVGPVNLKTWDGLATASVKTMNGLAMASVKTWDGLT